MNEVSLKFGSLLLDNTNNITISNISVKPSKNVQTNKIPQTIGSIAEEAQIAYLTITVEGDIAGNDADDLRTNLDALHAGLNNGFQKFTTDDDRYIIAQLKDFNKSYTSLRLHATWTATFIAHFPLWLSETEHTDERVPTSTVGYTINNAGNAPTRIKVEVTAPGGGIAYACKIENSITGKSFQYSGTIAAGEKLEVDNRYDTDDFQVLNDGVDDHTNFEGDFLTLEPGNNTIVYTGTANAIVKITHKDAYY
jgi:phage-related protein